MGLPRRKLSSCFVLFKAVFGIVRRLAHVERREGAALRGAIAGEFDDVDAVGARWSLLLPRCGSALLLRHCRSVAHIAITIRWPAILISFSGLPGVGKTAIARELA